MFIIFAIESRPPESGLMPKRVPLGFLRAALTPDFRKRLTTIGPDRQDVLFDSLMKDEATQYQYHRHGHLAKTYVARYRSFIADQFSDGDAAYMRIALSDHQITAIRYFEFDGDRMAFWEAAITAQVVSMPPKAVLDELRDVLRARFLTRIKETP